MFAEVDQKQMVDYVKVSIGLFAPRYDEEFSMTVASQNTIAAIAECFGVDESEVKSLAREFGDVAVFFRAAKK